eukprot:CAMPEP_0170778866 /NCGR_PEP_ID=MMETSP0733-20121128/12644_1 /TAXON_ID=186038 /ORGANISM="Fragilariopsis kerguelensis, Strain L26-C5" /LENGTH=370 /DNA_ID=CAMNT_0011122367 /DNA_START=362 /DNA_END=1474 /DNA_ORIENTATION=+
MITAQKFDAENEIVDDQQENASFGNSVAIVDNMMAIGSVGAERDDNKGAVYVYKRNKYGSWKLLKKVEGDKGDQLGFRVAMSTNTIVAGAPSANNNNGYVAVIDTLISQPVIQLEEVGGSPFSQFGRSVGISEDGNVIVVGSSSAGLFFYEKDTLGNWEIVQNVQIEYSNWDFFGSKSVAIDNEFVITTAKNANAVFEGREECIVFIYVRDSEGLWVVFESESLGYFELTGYNPKVSLSGNTIAVGLKNGFNSNNVQTGAVFIFTKEKVDNEAFTWKRTQNIFGPEDLSDLNFGRNVAISGNNMVVGHNTEGATYFYTQNKKGKWIEDKQVISENGGYSTGRSVSASGTTAALGVGYVNEFTGSVDVECF